LQEGAWRYINDKFAAGRRIEEVGVNGPPLSAVFRG